jgi:hypothetical protein
LKHKLGTCLAGAGVVALLSGCGVSGDQVADYCHAGLEGEILDQGYLPDFEYMSDAVNKDPNTGGYTVEGMAFSQSAQEKIAFNCAMDADGNYIASSFSIV